MSPPRYRRLSDSLRARFGGRVHKLPLKAAFSCPNRDGRRGRGGCVFCGGELLHSRWYEPGQPLAEQLARGAAFARERFGAARVLAYFQDYSATDAPLPELERLYQEALAPPEVAGLAVGTRPDVLGDEVVALLAELARDHYIQVELGLQSASDATLADMNRGHTVAEYEDAHRRLRAAGIPVVSHVIVGWPGEGPEDWLTTIRRLNELGTQGVKLHNLHVVSGTALAARYARARFEPPSREGWLDALALVLPQLAPDTVIHRLVSDTPRDRLVAPRWSGRKAAFIRDLDLRLTRDELWQGKALGAPCPGSRATGEVQSDHG
jgi:uncharacterized protein